MPSHCSACNKAGQPCSAQAWKDGLCRWHHPALEPQRAEERRKGGAARSNQSRARRRMAAEAMTPLEIQGFVAVALRGVMTGSITPGVANAVASLARAAVAVREATELEQRLTELERQAGVVDSPRWRA
jgi:hypothetical protein